MKTFSNPGAQLEEKYARAHWHYEKQSHAHFRFEAHVMDWG
jgi:hypothetical protein